MVDIHRLTRNDWHTANRTTGTDLNTQVRVQPFPIPAHTSDDFADILRESLGLLFVLAFMWPVSRLVNTSFRVTVRLCVDNSVVVGGYPGRREGEEICRDHEDDGTEGDSTVLFVVLHLSYHLLHLLSSDYHHHRQYCLRVL